MTMGMSLDPGVSAGLRWRRKGRGWLMAGGLVALLAAAGVAGWRWTVGRAPAAAAAAVMPDSLAMAPAGVRVRVQVTNASGVRGLARRATALLRERGFDVVGMDSERGGGRQRTEVVVHAGPLAWGDRVRRTLGTGTVAARPDSARYVDVLVRLGRDWQPPPQPLRP